MSKEEHDSNEIKIINTIISSQAPLSHPEGSDMFMENSRKSLMETWGVSNSKDLVFMAIYKGLISSDFVKKKPCRKLRFIDFYLIQIVYDGVHIPSAKEEDLPYTKHLAIRDYYRLLETLEIQNDEQLILEALKMGVINYIPPEKIQKKDNY